MIAFEGLQVVSAKLIKFSEEFPENAFNFFLTKDIN